MALKQNSLRISIIALLITSFFACVPYRQFSDLKEQKRRLEDDNAKLKLENEKLAVDSKECLTKSDGINKQLSILQTDTSITGKAFRKMRTQYNDINNLNDELIKKMEKLNQGNITESQKLLAELQVSKTDLLKKEDELKALEKELNTKKTHLEKVQTDLDVSLKQLEASKTELDKKAARVNELESILNRKDSTVTALKNKVSDALLGFENNGLTITQKNGKVYVSLDEQLLFASGSSQIDPKGAEALKKLAKVLEKNEDISVLIEGHTDNVPYNGSAQIKDNWDLSVMRATAVVKIITKSSSVNPKRLTAAGRSEYLPIDTGNTPEARKKNRRTEIILTPKLDELLKILESN